MSGADLEYQRMLAVSGKPSGVGLDGAALLQLDGQASVLRLGEAVQGLPLTVYGASQEAGPVNNSNASTCWPNRTANALGMTLTNRAIGGTEMSDQAFAMYALNSPQRFVPGTKGVVIISGWENDILRSGLAARRKETFQYALKACMYHAMCSSVIPINDASVVYTEAAGASTGLWSDQSVTYNGYQVTFKSDYNVGAYFTFTSPVGRDFVMFNYIRSTETFGSAGGPVSYTCDGQPILTNFQPPAAIRSAAPSLCPATLWAIPVVNQANQVHSIVGQVAGGPQPCIFNAGIGVIDRTSIPQIVLAKPCYTGNASLNGTIDAYRAWMDEVIQQVISECSFAASAITVIDAALGWDGPNYIGADLVHLKDRGQGAMSRAAIRTLGRLPYRDGMNK